MTYVVRVADSSSGATLGFLSKGKVVELPVATVFDSPSAARRSAESAQMRIVADLTIEPYRQAIGRTNRSVTTKWKG